MSELAALRYRDAVAAARARGASDLHLCADHAPTLRIDGRLEALSGAALGSDDLAAITDTPFDGIPARERSIAIDDPDLGPLRLHAFACDGAPALAVRLLSRRVPTLAALELPDAVARLCQSERGLIVIAGATGSGKSTTMAAMLDCINQRQARRIITIEDPVEYRHASYRSLISQRAIGCDAPDLASALHGVLRCDPDVIAIGELRTGLEIAGALTAADTGHLVLATVHTGDAVQTIDRILDAFEGSARALVRGQLAQALAGVICQRLVARPGGGRRALIEILLATDAVRALIRDGRTHQLRNAIATGRQFGMQSFEQHAQLLGSAG